MFAINTRTVNRSNPDKNFTVYSNTTIRETRKYLSCKSQNLLFYMLSMPTDWRFTLRAIADDYGNSESSVQRWISELRNNGHVQYMQEYDEHGNFAGGFYRVYETPLECCNDTILVRIDEKRKSQLEKERQSIKMQERQRVLAEIAEEEALRTRQSIGINIKKMFRDCFARLKKANPHMNANDQESVKLAFRDYLDECERHTNWEIRFSGAYNWMEKALRFRMQSDFRTAKISQSKDKRCAAVAANQQAQADYINGKTNELRGHTTKTTEQRMTDVSWDTESESSTRFDHEMKLD